MEGWKLGDHVDYSNEGWMDAQNWNSGRYIVNDDSSKRKNEKKKKMNYLERLEYYGYFKVFTIVGNYAHFEPGTPFTLVKEPYNKFDPDAIAVYFEDEKIGYVANSYSTVHELTASASDLRLKIPKKAKAEYLFTLSTWEQSFRIGRIK